jgi:hypothetical protein
VSHWAVDFLGWMGSGWWLKGKGRRAMSPAAAFENFFYFYFIKSSGINM